MLVIGIFPIDVSYFANWDSYSFSRLSRSFWILLGNVWHDGLKILGFYLLCHHFLQGYTDSLMCFPFIYCSVINDSWFKMSNISSLMESEVSVSVVGHEYVDRGFTLNSVDTTNFLYIWVSSFCSIVICNKVCHLFFNNWSTYLNWHNTIVSWWYFKYWFDLPSVHSCWCKLVLAAILLIQEIHPSIHTMLSHMHIMGTIDQIFVASSCSKVC